MSESTYHACCQQFGSHTAACDFYHNKTSAPKPTPEPTPALTERDENIICGVIVGSFLDSATKERLCAAIRSMAASVSSDSTPANKWPSERMPARCVWCGQDFFAPAAETLKAHTLTCTENPLVQRSAWQPIETGPKERRVLGGYQHRAYGWLWGPTRHYADPLHPDGGYWVMDNGGDPTHWIDVPLPSLPLDTSPAPSTETT